VPPDELGVQRHHLAVFVQDRQHPAHRVQQAGDDGAVADQVDFDGQFFLTGSFRGCKTGLQHPFVPDIEAVSFQRISPHTTMQPPAQAGGLPPGRHGGHLVSLVAGQVKPAWWFPLFCLHHEGPNAV